MLRSSDIHITRRLLITGPSNVFVQKALRLPGADALQIGQDRMRFLFTMLDNPPASPERKTSAKLGMFKDDVGAGNQPSGGARRDRTDDLMLAKHALSQLSYGPQANPEDLLVTRQPVRAANDRKHQRGSTRTQQNGGPGRT